MRAAAFIAAFVGIASAMPASSDAVTDNISPAGEKTPDGCQTTYNGKFQVVVQSLNKRDIEKRQSTALELTLKDGVLRDSQGRTGYIASNNQFQFDGPAQAGAIYTAGWSVCANNSIALGNSAIFYQCLSGTFYNLYDENTAAQCSAVFLNALASGPISAASGTAQANAVSTGAHTVVCQIGDGQIQQDTCITTATAAPVTSSKPTGGVVTQIGDGQIQAPASTTAAVTTPAAPKVQIPSGAVATQSGDGQVQVGNSSVPVTSRTPTATAPASSATAPPASNGGVAGRSFGSEVFGLVAAVAAIAFLL